MSREDEMEVSVRQGPIFWDSTGGPSEIIILVPSLDMFVDTYLVDTSLRYFFFLDLNTVASHMFLPFTLKIYHSPLIRFSSISLFPVQNFSRKSSLPSTGETNFPIYSPAFRPRAEVTRHDLPDLASLLQLEEPPYAEAIQEAVADSDESGLTRARCASLPLADVELETVGSDGLPGGASGLVPLIPLLLPTQGRQDK